MVSTRVTRRTLLKQAAVAGATLPAMGALTSARSAAAPAAQATELEFWTPANDPVGFLLSESSALLRRVSPPGRLMFLKSVADSLFSLSGFQRTDAESRRPLSRPSFVAPPSPGGGEL